MIYCLLEAWHLDELDVWLGADLQGSDKVSVRGRSLVPAELEERFTEKAE